MSCHTVRLGRHGAVDHRQGRTCCYAYFRDSTLARRGRCRGPRSWAQSLATTDEQRVVCRGTDE